MMTPISERGRRENCVGKRTQKKWDVRTGTPLPGALKMKVLPFFLSKIRLHCKSRSEARMRQREMPSAPHSLFFLGSLGLPDLRSLLFLPLFWKLGRSAKEGGRERDIATGENFSCLGGGRKGGGGEAPPEIECRAKERGSRG